MRRSCACSFKISISWSYLSERFSDIKWHQNSLSVVTLVNFANDLSQFTVTLIYTMFVSLFVPMKWKVCLFYVKMKYILSLLSEWILRCLGNKSRVEKSFTTDDVETTYEELNNTGRYIATVSWTPFDSKWNTSIFHGIEINLESLFRYKREFNINSSTL